MRNQYRISIISASILKITVYIFHNFLQQELLDRLDQKSKLPLNQIRS